MHTINLLVPTFALGGLVAALAILTRLARKKFGIGAGTISGESLRVVGKRTLEPRKSLYVVEIADRYVLVGTSDDGIALIDRITSDEFHRMVPKGELELVTPTDVSSADADEDADTEANAELSLAERLREEGRSATLGEGFQYLMSKARRSKTAQERVAAGVAAASSDADDDDAAEAI